MKKFILGFVLALVYSVSAYANGCGINGCGNGQSQLAGSQSQEQRQEVSQSPTMVMAGANNNNIISGNSTASQGIAIEGLNLSVTCPTNTFAVFASGGQNEIQNQPTWNTSTADNMNVTAAIVVPWGESVSQCHDREKTIGQAARVAYSKIFITSCMTFARAGLSVEQMTAVDETFKGCSNIIVEAEKGFHGNDNRKVARTYIKNQ